MLVLNQTWSEKAINYMKQGLNDGKSAAVIAKEMMEVFGYKYTRNSVIGKAHRLGISAGDRPAVKIKANTKPKAPPKPTTKIPKIVTVAKEHKELLKKFPNPKAKGVTFEALREGMCKFPIGDGLANMRFCGAIADSRKSRAYCSHCYSVSYIKMRS
jgi:hypothetical protein